MLICNKTVALMYYVSPSTAYILGYLADAFCPKKLTVIHTYILTHTLISAQILVTLRVNRDANQWILNHNCAHRELKLALTRLQPLLKKKLSKDSAQSSVCNGLKCWFVCMRYVNKCRWKRGSYAFSLSCFLPHFLLAQFPECAHFPNVLLTTRLPGPRTYLIARHFHFHTNTQRNAKNK